MPNHCGNSLYITGEYSCRDQLVKDVGKDDDSEPSFDLNKIMPMPKDVNWYEWTTNSNNWGTKWGCYNVSLEHNETDTQYTFQTAWGPFSKAIFEKLMTSYPELKFRLIFAERGCEYCGYYDSVLGYAEFDITAAHRYWNCTCENAPHKTWDETCDGYETLTDELKEYETCYDMSG
jgi:hypothetical protein